MNSQMKRDIEQGMWERVHSFHALSEGTTLSVSPHVHQAGRLSELRPSGFLWRLHYVGMSD